MSGGEGGNMLPGDGKTNNGQNQTRKSNAVLSVKDQRTMVMPTNRNLPENGATTYPE